MKTFYGNLLAADYVRTAIAKGVPLSGSVSPMQSGTAWIPSLPISGRLLLFSLGGLFLIEKIFNIEDWVFGYESIVERDYPVVLGTLVISSPATLLGNILSDLRSSS